MPNEILFAGGRFETVSVVGGVVNQVTTAGRFDSNYADQALNHNTFTGQSQSGLYTVTGNILTPRTVTSGTFYTHYDHYGALYGGGAPGTNMVELVDSNSHPWFAIRGVNGSLFGIHYNTGTGASPSWTIIGSTSAIGNNTLESFDIEFIFGSPNTVNVYRNGSLWRNGTFTQGLFTNIAGVRYGQSGNDGMYSQLLSTEGISTIGAKVRTIRATGAGTTNQWSNTHTAVNEVTASDLTVQSAATAGLKSTHAMGDITVPTGFEIRTVFNWMRAKNDGAAPNNIKSVLRQGGVDYATANLSGVGVGYASVGARYDLAPNGTNWTQSELNAIEAGYESAT